MPHSAKSSRSNLTGAKPRPRAYTQGSSTARKVHKLRQQAGAKVYTRAAKTPFVQPGPITIGSNFIPSSRRGPQIIKFASPTQEAGFNYGPYPAAFSGGFGSGKTWDACMKGMYLSATYPGNRGLIARKQGEKLRKTTMKTFFKVCPPEAYLYGSRSDQAKSLTLNNGSEILWSQLDDSEIVELLRGLEINWFFIDQAEEVSEEIYEVLLRRLGRWDQAVVPQYLIDAEHAAGREWPWINEETGKPLPPTYAMIACNPDHELHWIYRRFHEESPEWQATYSKQGYKMFHFDSTDNIFLPTQNRQLLLQGTPEFVDRFVHGKWGIPEGQIHNISPLSLLRWSATLEEILKTCILGRTLDHGESSPTCCLWWAIDRWGNTYCYREYYRPNRLISDHRESIHQLSLRKAISNIGGTRSEEWVMERYARELADPSIFNPRTQRGVAVSVAEEYNEVNESKTDAHSAVWWQRADNNELGTRNRINEFLKLDPAHKHPITGELGAPRIYFIERTSDYPYGCVEVLRETRSQRRIKVGTQDGKDVFSDDRDESIVDHAYDCFSADTQVITPGGLVRFDELPEHGTVLTPDGWDSYFGARMYRQKGKLIRLRFNIGSDMDGVTCTPDHLFKSRGRWVPARDLLGLPLDAFSELVVRSIFPVDDGDSYCLTTDNPAHAFCIEGGIVVHNCVRYWIADLPALPVEAIRRPPPGTVAHTIAEFRKQDSKHAHKRISTSRLGDLSRLPPRLADFYRRTR